MDEINDNLSYGTEKEVIIITGSNGLIGSLLIERLSKKYLVVGLDRTHPSYSPHQAESINFDVTDEKPSTLP
ncbi:NAD-dependent epimerase/dehydratase family protein [Flagellimonas abyssi]|uniref:NAD-dependent epimerase/dehydratase family protein n=1 Tax=Flagellimonas abyssi TaxID=2864871 RepID=A0ABS7ERJ1_9FLAO|nr:NAD-dependent epimerase/dehydratase family protein [Allomuricauda abyssi]MBW8199654.1 NAD-dependent epimerase/dehydratase family protein [Allomuricauda abyssi]